MGSSEFGLGVTDAQHLLGFVVKHVLDETAVLYGGGVESLALLSLLREVAGVVPVPVLSLHGPGLSERGPARLEQLADEWELDVVDIVLPRPFDSGVLAEVCRTYGFDVVLLATRQVDAQRDAEVRPVFWLHDIWWVCPLWRWTTPDIVGWLREQGLMAEGQEYGPDLLKPMVDVAADEVLGRLKALGYID